MGAYCIKCKNCEYFEEDEFFKNFGPCGNKIIESSDQPRDVEPKPNTKIILFALNKESAVLYVHKYFGCIEGIAKEKIDKKRGKVR